MSGFDSLTAELHAIADSPTKNEDQDTPIENVEEQDAAPEPLSREERRERRLKLSEVKIYLKNFPTKLEDFADREQYPIDSMGYEDLDTMLDDMKETLGETNSIGLYQSFAEYGSLLIETTLPKFTPLKLQGLSASLKMSDEFQDCIKELALEYGGIRFLPPSYRLLVSLMTTVQLTHSINTMKEVQSSTVEKKQVAKELAEKYTSL